jgi:hypothetical protein
MVSAGSAVLGDAFQDRLDRAPGNEAVNESVAPTVLEVGVCEALPEEAVEIVGEL